MDTQDYSREFAELKAAKERCRRLGDKQGVNIINEMIKDRKAKLERFKCDNYGGDV